MATPSTSAVVRDVNQVPIPQAWNPVTQVFEQIDEQDNQMYAAPHPDATGNFAYSTVYTSASLEQTNVVKNVAGTLYKVFITSTETTTGPWYFQLFNLSATPTSGSSVAVFSQILVNGTTVAVPFDIYGVKYSTGIVWAVSSTPIIYTSTSVNSKYLVFAYAA